MTLDQGSATVLSDPLAVIRLRTRDLHAQLESRVDLRHAFASRENYIRLLQSYLGIFRPLESRFEALSPSAQALLAWPQRRKSHLIERDLAALGHYDSVAASNLAPLPDLANLDAAFGALYVVEGSCLGSQFLYREVHSALGLDASSGAAFFYGYGTSTGSMWTAFTALLRQHVTDTDCAADAACSLFHFFETGLVQPTHNTHRREGPAAMSNSVVDIDSCAREPIHIPGSIQPHGVLFVLHDPYLKVVQVSENCEALLGVPAQYVLEDGLTAVLDPGQVAQVRFAIDSVDPTDQNPVRFDLPGAHPGLLFDGVVHSHNGFQFLELEPAAPRADPAFLDFYKSVSTATDQLHNAPHVRALADEAAAFIRRVTGFDRVMVYRFAPEGQGEVIAEDRDPSIESFYGLWYPASDIPEQARALYLISPIRGIPQVPYQPVPLLPAINPVSHAPTDLSFAALRSVSPVHCEYLVNMGVTASMSVSIVCRGKLWGLIACHHASPRFVPYEMRKACTFFGQVLSGEIVRRETEQEFAYRSSSTTILARLLESMASANSPLTGLAQVSPGLLDLIPCSGAAIVTGDIVRPLGVVPSFDKILDLAHNLRQFQTSSLFSTHSLRTHIPSAESLHATASGLISLEIARDPATFILFFRPEVAQTIQWAGDPNKPATQSEELMRLSPRKSFELFKDEVLGSSEPWTEAEISVAAELKKLALVLLANGNRPA